ncbi:PREDICTED: ubiquitin carboxyl-terminal hydrolase 34-like [Acropora digitifera]|uniref:ubiquitin carboxyl-terminal hydrolase 34-like n=1 Tax=Acropora digitifera TaxID=70779 RepID=UPI00077A124F|nr:PREDICTED: ubiquitin carboxyl-terminal hydrolase 34-like [Acropora digitifera]
MNCVHIGDGEVPEALLVNVAFFCDKGGLSAIREAFQDASPISLPFPLAHHLINIVTQLRLWFSIQAIMQYIIPLRRPVIRYLCKLTDKDLRQPDGRLMVDSMWSAVKGPVESGPICDKDSLDLAFKYFTSSTLTVRLAGLSQIANQVHMFMDPFHTDPAAEADRQCLCKELSEWLIENKLVEHLFGPNLHVELLKQSQIILNYLARETFLTTSHLDCIWLAAQVSSLVIKINLKLGCATNAAVASVMKRKFGRTASLSQSSSRSGSLSDISCDGDQLDLDESPVPHGPKYAKYVKVFNYCATVEPQLSKVVELIISLIFPRKVVSTWRQRSSHILLTSDSHTMAELKISPARKRQEVRKLTLTAPAAQTAMAAPSLTEETWRSLTLMVWRMN